jgi:hypothetical protein
MTTYPNDQGNAGGAIPVWQALPPAAGNGKTQYQTVAASQTDAVLGPTGAKGDYLKSIWVVPTNTSPGAISIKDGSGSSITLFAGGTGSISNLVPFQIAWDGAQSASGAWKVTTGANLSVIAFGAFTP